jgi:beta-lactamase class A
MAAIIQAAASYTTSGDTIEAEDVASGTYRYMTPGCVIPFRDMLVNMMITSDNVCTQAVLERLGPETMDSYCHGIGMTGTHHRGLIPPLGIGWDHPVDAVATTTQSDQVLLLNLILRGTEDAMVARRLGSTPELCRLAMDILSWQVLRNLIPSLLPYGTKVAHKTGRGRRGRSHVAPPRIAADADHGRVGRGDGNRLPSDGGIQRLHERHIDGDLAIALLRA